VRENEKGQEAMNTFYTHRRAKSADVGALSLAMSSASAGTSGPFDQTASGWGWAGTDEEPIECVGSPAFSGHVSDVSWLQDAFRRVAM
jgi:hypothetical protein